MKNKKITVERDDEYLYLKMPVEEGLSTEIDSETGLLVIHSKTPLLGIVYECRYCGYEWSPKNPKPPKHCPECKNKWWREPKYNIKRDE